MLRLSSNKGEQLANSQQLNVHFGGSESNVAVSLSRLGIDTSFTSVISTSELGEGALQSLNKYGVNTDSVLRTNDRQGIYFLEPGHEYNSSKVIYDRANSAIANCNPTAMDWDSIFKGANWFHWSGITPGLSNSAAQMTLLAVKKANDLGLIVSCDLNYRSKLWNYGKHPNEILPELIKNTSVFIGGLDDIGACLKINPFDTSLKLTDQIRDVYEQMQQVYPNLKTIAGGIRIVNTASNHDYSAVIFNEGKLVTSKSYNLQNPIDRVGAGDSLMAGLIYGLIKNGTNIQRTIDFAVAAAVIKHSIKGDVNLASLEEINAVMESADFKIKR